MNPAARSKPCPLCSAPTQANARYPRAVCSDCGERATDSRREPVKFGNAGLSGGLVSSSPHAPVINGQASCFIDDVACVAEEARFGGIVIQVSETSMDGLRSSSDVQLLAQHSAVLDELRRRGILRSRNNPTGDYGEWLVSTRLGLTLADPSEKGFDALDANGLRYQIKARRLSSTNPSRQLGVLRNLAGKDFDFLVAVLFAPDWSVKLAVRIPHAVVADVASFRAHVNGHVMHLRLRLLEHGGVQDITELLR